MNWCFNNCCEYIPLWISQRYYLKHFHILNNSGLLHNEDGPALIFENGTEYYFKNGKLHREDGPAIILINGINFWYIEDMEICEYT